jgi:DNA topoisomerase-3
MLVFTEKYFVAKDFAAALGCSEKNGYFENRAYCILWCNGHLFQPFTPEEYRPALKQWRRDTLPIVPARFQYSPISHTKKERNIIEYMFARHAHDDLVIATDPEREGELIARLILNEVPNSFRSIRRFWCSQTLTKEVIWRELKRAKPLDVYDPYYKQALARQQADWLLGINLTRFFTVTSGSLLHIGRVQTTILKEIYQRNKIIAEFKKDGFSELIAVVGTGKPFTAKLVSDTGITAFPVRSPYLDTAIFQCSREAYAAVQEIQKNEVCEYPPRLYNQSALQEDAYRLYGIMPGRTEAICQKLYAVYKCISYPRTDSRFMSDTDEDKCLLIKIFRELSPRFPAIAGHARLDNLAGNKHRIFDSREVSGHTALIPLAMIRACGVDERTIYNLIIKNFFTVFAGPHRYEKLVVRLSIGGYRFIAHGITTIQKGYRAIRSDTVPTIGDIAKDVLHGPIPVIRVYCRQDTTTPPEHYTIDSLIHLMSNPSKTRVKKPVGLGTAATRHIIITLLLEREYITVVKKRILLTEKGMKLIEKIIRYPELSSFFSLDKALWWEKQIIEHTTEVLPDIRRFITDTVASFTAR